MFGDKASPKTEAEPLFPGMSEDRSWFQDSILGMCGFPKQCSGALGRQGHTAHSPAWGRRGGNGPLLVCEAQVLIHTLWASWALTLNSRIQALKALEDGEG